MKRVFFVFLLAALCGCSNPTENKPQATVKTPGASPAAQAGATPIEGGKTFTLTEKSQVGFVGSKVTGSHEGGFEKVTGTVVTDGTAENMQVSITMDMASTFSDSEKLTGHLKSPDFFDVEKFPTATFNSSQVVKKDDGYEVTGDLTFHGVTKTLTFPAKIGVSDDKVVATAEFVIMREDFGVKYPGKPDDLIKNEVLIKFDVVAAPEA